VVRITDGHLQGKRDLPRSEWLLTAGRNVAVLGVRPERERRDYVLTMLDVLSQDELYEVEFPITGRVSIVGPHAIAVFEPSGKLRLIDVRTGAAIIDQQLEPVSDLQSLQTIQSGDTLFVVISVQVPRQQQHKPIGQFDYPIVSGMVYAFSISEGKPLWPGPATIRNRGIVHQPENIPFLVFADRQMSNEAAGGGKWNMRLLCLDRETGETVYRNDKLPDAAVTRFRIRGSGSELVEDSRAERSEVPGQDQSHMVTMHTNAGTIQLTMTDRPRPPRPPGNDELEAAPVARQRGLVGLGERMGSALRGAIERNSEDRRAPRGANGREGQPRANDLPEQIDDD
jgi:hypothetical protein